MVSDKAHGVSGGEASAPSAPLCLRHCFADIVMYGLIIMKALNRFLMTESQMSIKNECGYKMLVNFIGKLFRTLS